MGCYLWATDSRAYIFVHTKFKLYIDKSPGYFEDFLVMKYYDFCTRLPATGSLSNFHVTEITGFSIKVSWQNQISRLFYPWNYDF